MRRHIQSLRPKPLGSLCLLQIPITPATTSIRRSLFVSTKSPDSLRFLALWFSLALLVAKSLLELPTPSASLILLIAAPKSQLICLLFSPCPISDPSHALSFSPLNRLNHSLTFPPSRSPISPKSPSSSLRFLTQIARLYLSPSDRLSLPRSSAFPNLSPLPPLSVSPFIPQIDIPALFWNSLSLPLRALCRTHRPPILSLALPLHHPIYLLSLITHPSPFSL